MSFACLNVILAICQKVGKQLSTKLIFLSELDFFASNKKEAKRRKLRDWKICLTRWDGSIARITFVRSLNSICLNNVSSNNICSNNFCSNNICLNNIFLNNICLNNICSNKIYSNNICSNKICSNNIYSNNICSNNICSNH